MQSVLADKTAVEGIALPPTERCCQNSFAKKAVTKIRLLNQALQPLPTKITEEIICNTCV